MNDRTLIIAKFDPDDRDRVAEIFQQSDQTELPHLMGVARRTLFEFNGLYLHLIESDGSIRERVSARGNHPLFTQISNELADYITPYRSDWAGPRDAMATSFYDWKRE